MPELLLQSRMTVIPIGARLFDRETVSESLPRLDTGERHPRHAVHTERQQNAMPVNGCIFIQIIGDIKNGFAPFFKPD